MTKKITVILSLILCGGCASTGGRKITQPNLIVEPVVEAKQNFIDRYGFFMNKTEMKELSQCVTVECVKTFEQDFFFGNKEKNKPSRDTDPNTPENEFKMLIDSRLEDIKREIFVNDIETPGLRFASSGGFRGDLAHVYLFYGAPHFKAKLLQNKYHVEMVVWYYFDEEGKHLFRFLFYNRDRYRVFKNYIPILSYEYLLDPVTSPLKDISLSLVPTPQDLSELWTDLLYDKEARPFVLALMEFSYYTDVTIDEALAPPDPAALTAGKYKPQIVGEPEDISSRNMVFGKFHSFIPADIRISKDTKGNPLIYSPILYSNLDWEIKDGKAESKLALRVNILNKKTRKSFEFVSIITVTLPEKEVRTVKGFNLMLNSLGGVSSGRFIKFQDFIEQLVVGEYRLDVDMFDLRTMKQAIAIKDFSK